MNEAPFLVTRGPYQVAVASSPPCYGNIFIGLWPCSCENVPVDPILKGCSFSVKKRCHTEPFLGTILWAFFKFYPKNLELKMVLDGIPELKTVLDCFPRTYKKIQKMVPKSRTIKSSSHSLKRLKVPYDTFFFREFHRVAMKNRG